MKTVIFIDSYYLDRLSRHLDMHIDFLQFKEALQDYFDSPVRIYYYSCTVNKIGDEFIPSRPLLDWLKFNGYHVRHNALNPNFFDAERRAFTATQIAVDALSLLPSEDRTFVFCVAAPEFYDVITTVGKHNHVILMTLDLDKDSHHLLPHLNLRQSVDRIINIDRDLLTETGQQSFLRPRQPKEFHDEQN